MTSSDATASVPAVQPGAHGSTGPATAQARPSPPRQQGDILGEPLLIAEGLHKAYEMGHTRLEVLRGCNLRVRAGEFVAIMGKSGSGKSTLLQILGALDVPDRGELTFAGQPTFRSRTKLQNVAARLDRILHVVQRIAIVLLKVLLVVNLVAVPAGLLLMPAVTRLPQGNGAALEGVLGWLFAKLGALALLGALAVSLGSLLGSLALLVLALLIRLVLVHLVEGPRVALRRHQFGFVFQFYHLLPELNVLENALIARQVGSSIWRWFGRRRQARADALDVIKRVGLLERLKHRPAELSGGERQRVAIARALVHRPQILFADEPTGNLDAEAGAALMSLLKRLHREGQTIVMVTHDPGIAAQADRVLRLEDGVLRTA
ncbi:MAG: ABC transporter ATP-binding protein [Planctomycetota bacterium]